MALVLEMRNEIMLTVLDGGCFHRAAIICFYTAVSAEKPRPYACCNKCYVYSQSSDSHIAKQCFGPLVWGLLIQHKSHSYKNRMSTYSAAGIKSVFGSKQHSWWASVDAHVDFAHFPYIVPKKWSNPPNLLLSKLSAISWATLSHTDKLCVPLPSVTV